MGCPGRPRVNVVFVEDARTGSWVGVSTMPSPRRRDNGWRLFSMSLAKWLRNQPFDPCVISIYPMEDLNALSASGLQRHEGFRRAVAYASAAATAAST